jgi:DNA-binding NarL/FixJ family response regulator
MPSIEYVYQAAPTPEGRADALASTITSLECDIAALVAEGLTDAEIAGRLGLPEATVSAHVEAAMRTLTVRSRLRLAVWAAERGRAERPGGVY